MSYENEAQIELADGRIIASFDPESGELLGLEDWHGECVYGYWENVAKEAIEDFMAEKINGSRS